MTDAELIERLRHGVTWSDGKLIGAVVGEANDPIMREAADRLEAIANKLQRMEEALAAAEGKAQLAADALGNSPASFRSVQAGFQMIADEARAALKD